MKLFNRKSNKNKNVMNVVFTLAIAASFVIVQSAEENKMSVNESEIFYKLDVNSHNEDTLRIKKENIVPKVKTEEVKKVSIFDVEYISDLQRESLKKSEEKKELNKLVTDALKAEGYKEIKSNSIKDKPALKLTK